MTFVDLEAGRFYYRDSGGDGDVLVFTHGFLLDHGLWEMQVAELQSDYRCIVWDQRMHGDTEADGPHSFWDSAGDLLALLDHLGVDRFVHVGMSQGGFIGLRVALSAPERVRALVFVDSQAGGEPPDALPLYEGMVAQWVAGTNVEEIAGAAASILIGGDVDASGWIEKWMARDPQAVSVIFETLVSREDLHDRLGEITCPALVLHGDADMAIPMELAERLAEGLVGAGEVVVIEGAGHAANLANPLAVSRAISSFLAEAL